MDSASNNNHHHNNGGTIEPQSSTFSASTQKDLDVFLATLESKVRGPFSSSDLAKAMSSVAALQRDKTNQHEYMQRLQQVLHKTDKITQLRILIALLGVESTPTTTNDDDDTTANDRSILDQDVWDLLQQTQQTSSSYEDWVRTCSGLVQGSLFETEDNTALLGAEARKLLDKTTNQILDRVTTLERQTEYEEDDDFVPSRLDKADAHPTWVPYRYALLNPTFLPHVLPETLEHAHFTVNESASVLQLDATLERAKLDDAMEHALGNHKGTAAAAVAGAGTPSPSSLNKASTSNGGAGRGGASGTVTRPNGTAAPGGTTTNKRLASAVSRPKASMFMPAKKPAQVVQGGKTTLHARRAGAAQALLAKRGMGGGAGGRFGGGAGAGGDAATASTSASSATTKAAGGAAVPGKGRAAALLGSHSSAASRMGSAKSKMMTIDVAEVQNLNQQQREHQQPPPSSVSGHKRKAASGSAAAADAAPAPTKPHKQSKRHSSDMEAAAASKAKATAASSSATPRLPVAATTSETVPSTASTAIQETGAALVSAALSAYQGQQQLQQQQQQPPPSAAEAAAGLSTAGSTSGGKGGLDWRDMLKKSNRLSDDDRTRIQLFFANKVNPTPDELTYRMKLHEERVIDPQTGNPIKETYYLDLDYTNFTSRQSKKTKRYKE